MKRCRYLIFLTLCLAAFNYAGTAIATSTEPQDPKSTSDPVIADCSDDPVLKKGKNEPEIIWGNGQYTGRQELNVLKHLKTPKDPNAPKGWQFWMTDYTKNCSHVHFYSDSYDYGSGAEVPLFTGKFPKQGESIGDGEPYRGKCCDPGSGLPNENALTVAADVSAGINAVYAFNKKYYKVNGEEMKGVDEWETQIEAFTLSSGEKPKESAAYLPSEPNEEGKYDSDNPLTHNITFYTIDWAYSMFSGYYRSSTYPELAAHELRHATQFSTWFDADTGKMNKWPNDEKALEEDFAYLYQISLKNWFKSGKGSTLCGSNPCIWTMDEESNSQAAPTTNLADPNNDESTEPYVYIEDEYPERAMIAAYAFYAASEGLKKCTVANPKTDYVKCPAGTNAFIDQDFAGLGIDTAFKIFGYVDQEFEPSNIYYKTTKGLSLYKADREWPAKDSSGKYLPKEISDSYKVFDNAFQAVNIPSDSDSEYGSIAELSLAGTSQSVDPAGTIDLKAVATESSCSPGRYNLRAYVDGKPLADQQGRPIDLDFTMCDDDSEEKKTFNYSKLPVKVTDEAGNLKKNIELDVVLWDIYGADRIVASKTIPIKGTNPNVKPPEITFKGPSGESPDSSTSKPIYKARLEAEASEGRPLNPDGAYFVLDTGVEKINVEVSEDKCQVSDQEIVCDTEFAVDSRYHEDEGYVQDPDDGGTSEDDGEHKDHEAGLSYVEYGSSGEGAPE